MSIYYTIPWSGEKNIGKTYNDFMALLPFENDYACFIDADAMFLTSDFGKQLNDIVEKYPDCGLFTCMTNRVKFKKQVIGDWDLNDIKEHRKIAQELQKKQYDEIDDLSNIIEGCLSGVVILIRKSTWRKIGGFMDGFLGVDNDIHIKAYRNFEKCYLMKGVYVYHWYRGGDLTKNPHKSPDVVLKEKKEAIVERGKKLKKIIYTAITGDYEKPIVHQIPEGWEFRIFTNKARTPGAILVGNEGLSDVKLARKIKIMPWKYFDFDYCLWIDGNTVFNRDQIENLTKSNFVISKHPERDCIYEEGEAVVNFGKEDPETVDYILSRYREEGYPEKNGLVASHAILRKNTLKNKHFCEKWWEEVEKNSHRDQMSFNYVLWRNPMDVTYIPFRTIFRTTHIHRNRLYPHLSTVKN